MLPALPQVALLACNTLLNREPWARERLRAHAHKIVVLHLDHRQYRWQVNAEGYLDPAPAQAEAQVQVRLALRHLPNLMATDPHTRLQALHIEGEAALAQTLAGLAQDLRWDAEDDLAHWLGDIPARRLVQGSRWLLQQLRRSGQHFLQNLSEYATHESHTLPRRVDYQQWQSANQDLHQRSQHLLQRAAALLPPEHPDT